MVKCIWVPIVQYNKSEQYTVYMWNTGDFTIANSVSCFADDAVVWNLLSIIIQVYLKGNVPIVVSTVIGITDCYSYIVFLMQTKFGTDNSAKAL